MTEAKGAYCNFTRFFMSNHKYWNLTKAVAQKLEKMKKKLVK